MLFSSQIWAFPKGSRWICSVQRAAKRTYMESTQNSGLPLLSTALSTVQTCPGGGGPPPYIGPSDSSCGKHIMPPFQTPSEYPGLPHKLKASICEPNRRSTSPAKKSPSTKAAKKREVTSCTGEKLNQPSELSLTMALQIGRLTGPRQRQAHTTVQGQGCGWWAALCL